MALRDRAAAEFLNKVRAGVSRTVADAQRALVRGSISQRQAHVSSTCTSTGQRCSTSWTSWTNWADGAAGGELHGERDGQLADGQLRARGREPEDLRDRDRASM